MHNECTLCSPSVRSLLFQNSTWINAATIYYFKVQEITATLSHPFLQMMRWRNWTTKLLWRTSLIRSIRAGKRRSTPPPYYSDSLRLHSVIVSDHAAPPPFGLSEPKKMMMMMRDLFSFIPLSALKREQGMSLNIRWAKSHLQLSSIASGSNSCTARSPGRGWELRTEWGSKHSALLWTRSIQTNRGRGVIIKS